MLWSLRWKTCSKEPCCCRHGPEPCAGSAPQPEHRAGPSRALGSPCGDGTVETAPAAGASAVGGHCCALGAGGCGGSSGTRAPPGGPLLSNRPW